MITNPDVDIENNPDEGNTVAKAHALQEAFHSLVFFIITAVKISATRFKMMINFSLQYARQNTPDVRSLLDELQRDAQSVEDVIMFLINRNLLGYMNYGVLNVLRKIVDDEEVIRKLDQYKEQHNEFIRTNFASIIKTFKKNPRLAPPSFVGLPEIQVQLQDHWKDKSLYSWNEIVRNIADWPDHILIKKVDFSCVVITYYIFPFILSRVLIDLDDTTIVKRFASVGATFIISPELRKLGQRESEWISKRVEYAMAVVKMSSFSDKQGERENELVCNHNLKFSLSERSNKKVK